MGSLDEGRRPQSGKDGAIEFPDFAPLHPGYGVMGSPDGGRRPQSGKDGSLASSAKQALQLVNDGRYF